MLYCVRRRLSDLCYFLSVWLDPRIWIAEDKEELSADEWIAHDPHAVFVKKPVDWLPSEDDLEALDNERCPLCGGSFYEGVCNLCLSEEE